MPARLLTAVNPRLVRTNGGASRRRWRPLFAAILLAACAPKRPPEEADLALLRAENALAQGRHDWARIYFRNHYEAHPEHLDSLRQEALAWSSGYLQSLSTAVERFEAYLALQPDDVEIRRRLASTQLLLGDFEAAAETARTLPEGPEEDLLRAEALQETAPEEALRAVRASLEVRPWHARARTLAAELKEQLGNDDAALANTMEAVRLQPLLSGSYYQLARLWRRGGDLEATRDALEAYRLASRISSDGTMAPLPPEEALEETAKLEELFRRRFATPQDVAAPLPLPLARKRVELLFASGRRAEAAAAAREVLARRDGAGGPVMSVTERLELAVAADQAGQQRFAREIFEDLLREHPDNRGAIASLALLDLRSGDLAAAEARLEAGLAAHPDFARYHYLRGRVAVAEGDGDEADRHLSEAVHLAPWEWSWRETYADLLLARGEHDAFRRLVQEAPEETPAREAYERAHRRLLEGS